MFYIMLLILIILTVLILFYTIRFYGGSHNFFYIIFLLFFFTGILLSNLLFGVLGFIVFIIVFKLLIFLLSFIMYWTLSFLLSPLGLDLLYTVICKLFILLYSLICTYYFVNYYYTSRLSFKIFMFRFLLSIFFNIILLFFTNMFMLNTLSFIQSFLLSSILLIIFTLSLIFLFKVFYRNYLLSLYLFISNVLKFIIILYFMSLFYSHIEILLSIILETFSLNLLLKIICIVGLSYSSGSFMFSIIFLYLLLDKSFFIIFILILKFFIIVIFLLSCYYFYNFYLFNLLFSRVYVVFKSSFKPNLLIKPYLQQSLFRRGLHTAPSGELFCNIYYPNTIPNFLDKSLVFNNGNKGVNFYCNQDQLNSILNTLYIFDMHSTKVSYRVSTVNFRSGIIAYLGICELRGYSFVDVQYFLIHFNKSANLMFYNNSLKGIPFYKGVSLEVDPNIWISRLEDNGVFKESFLQSISCSDSYFNISNYNLSIVKCSPNDKAFNVFPLVSVESFLIDLDAIKTQYRSDNSYLTTYVLKNNRLIKKLKPSYESDVFLVLTFSSLDYAFYLKNCNGRIGS